MKNKILNLLILVIMVLLIISINLPTYATSTNYARAFGSYIKENESGALQNPIDTRPSVQHAQNVYSSMGYNSGYVIDPSALTMRSNFAIQPTILLIRGHAGPEGFGFKKSYLGFFNIDDSLCLSYNNLPNGSFDNMKLLILMGCSTASQNSTSNIWKESCVRVNYRCSVIGWKNVIYTAAANPWCQNFNTALGQGKTVSQAMSYADSQNYINNSVKDRMALGGLSQTLNLSATNEIASVVKDNFETEKAINESNFYYPSEIIEYDENNVKNISEYISKIYNEKNIESNYKITTSNSTNIDDAGNSKEVYIIDYTLQIGGFDTTKGYSVHIEDGKVKYIANNMNLVNKSGEEKSIKDNDIVKLSNDFKMHSNIEEIINKSKATSARKCLVTTPTSHNENQEVQFYYDVDNDKHYIIVHTTNNLKYDIKSVISDYYEI